MKKLILLLGVFLSMAPCYGQRSDAQIVTISEQENSRLSPALKRNAEAKLNFENLLEKAMLGDAQAMLDLSHLYATGTGVKRDREKAFFWIKRATDLDFGPAWTALGVCYKYGRGVPVDYAQAYRCFSKAAAHQHPAGLYSSGFMQYKGLGCPQNYAAALADFNRGADLGDPLCMYMMGLCYRNGFGVVQDIAQADFWLNKAAELGITAAESELDRPESEIDARARELMDKSKEAKALLNYAAYNPNEFNRISDIASNLSGISYRGFWIKYDWSGEHIVKTDAIALTCQENAGILNCELAFKDSETRYSFKGTVGNDNTITSNDFRLKRNDRYVTSSNDQLFITQIQLGLRTTDSGENLLLGEASGFSTHEAEPERPIKIVLQRSNEFTESSDAATRMNVRAYVFPNPFTDQCSIHLDVEEATSCRIAIADINGRIVYQSSKAELPQGSYVYPLQAELAPGTYFVTLLFNNDFRTLKLIKL